MEGSGTSFSLSSLLCEEDEASLKDDYENTSIGKDLINPCFVLENEDEYIANLFTREMGFGSQSHLLSSDDCSSTGRVWLKSARVDSIDWIFNTGAKFGFEIHTAYLSVTYFDRFLSKRSIDEGKPWAIQLLSVACLSLAAKIEEQKVPPLSEFPVEDYCFESKTIKNMELLILGTLEWKMGSVTPFAYLHYFFKRFCAESRPEAIVSKAVEHILAILKDINLMDHRPSIIASAAILAAFDDTLTRKTVDLQISLISSWGSLESERVFSCYNLMQEKERMKIKTPPSNLLSTTTTHSSSSSVLENSSLTSCGAKRKLNFADSENFPEQKMHRP